jgi:ligand-binding SRPBCC domain-containing protein
MRIHTLHPLQHLDGEPDEVFPYFADARNLEAITPPSLRFRIITPDPIVMGVGTFIQYALRLRGVPVRWDTLIQAWEPPHRFVDVQVRGPYRLWHHTHVFAADGSGGTTMTDTVRWAAPLDRLSAPVVRRDVEAIFGFRREALVRAPPCPAPRAGRRARGTSPSAASGAAGRP